MYRFGNKSIDCPYDMFTNPTPDEDKKIYLHPRATGVRKTNTKQLVKSMYSESKTRQIEAENIINNFLDKVAESLCEGNSVHIPGLGTLHVKLKGPAKVTSAEKVRSEHIELAGISLTPDRKLVNEMKQCIHFVRSKTPTHSAKLDLAGGVIDVLADFFSETHSKSVSSGALMKFYNVKQKYAQGILKQGIEDGLLENYGIARTAPLYVPTQELKDYMEA